MWRRAGPALQPAPRLWRVLALAPPGHDCRQALRAWRGAWEARVDWQREHFDPLEDREQSVVYGEVPAVRQKLKDAEERAWRRPRFET